MHFEIRKLSFRRHQIGQIFLKIRLWFCLKIFIFCASNLNFVSPYRSYSPPQPKPSYVSDISEKLRTEERFWITTINFCVSCFGFFFPIKNSMEEQSNSNDSKIVMFQRTWQDFCSFIIIIALFFYCLQGFPFEEKGTPFQSYPLFIFSSNIAWKRPTSFELIKKIISKREKKHRIFLLIIF